MAVRSELYSQASAVGRNEAQQTAALLEVSMCLQKYDDEDDDELPGDPASTSVVLFLEDRSSCSPNGSLQLTV